MLQVLKCFIVIWERQRDMWKAWHATTPQLEYTRPTSICNKLCCILWGGVRNSIACTCSWWWFFRHRGRQGTAPFRLINERRYVHVCLCMCIVPQLIIVYMPRAGAIFAGTSSFPTVRFEFLEVGEILISTFDFGAKCVQHSQRIAQSADNSARERKHSRNGGNVLSSNVKVINSSEILKYQKLNTEQKLLQILWITNLTVKKVLNNLPEHIFCSILNKQLAQVRIFLLKFWNCSNFLFTQNIQKLFVSFFFFWNWQHANKQLNQSGTCVCVCGRVKRGNFELKNHNEIQWFDWLFSNFYLFGLEIVKSIQIKHFFYLLYKINRVKWLEKFGFTNYYFIIYLKSKMY